MKTLFVSGSDTDVGKTWVVAAIVRELRDRNESVQIVKPVQTGVGNGIESDVSIVQRQVDCFDLEAYTLFSYALPIAPVAAARLERESLKLESIVSRLEALPRQRDWRIIEGAGSLATPIAENGEDWTDFATAIGLSRVVLVVDNRVGGIGQSRLAHCFAARKGLESGIVLNESCKQDPVLKSATESGIRESGIPLLGTIGFNGKRFDEGSLDWL